MFGLVEGHFGERHIYNKVSTRILGRFWVAFRKAEKLTAECDEIWRLG